MYTVALTVIQLKPSLSSYFYSNSVTFVFNPDELYMNVWNMGDLLNKG